MSFHIAMRSTSSSGTGGCAPEPLHGAYVVARLTEILNDLAARAFQLLGDRTHENLDGVCLCPYSQLPHPDRTDWFHTIAKWRLCRLLRNTPEAESFIPFASMKNPDRPILTLSFTALK